MVRNSLSAIISILFLAMQCYAQGEIKVTSSVFKDGAELPAKYRGDNENIAPPLAWSGVPKGAKSLAIICEDPDVPVGTFVHWILFNIPPEVTNIDAILGLDAGAGKKKVLTAMEGHIMAKGEIMATSKNTEKEESEDEYIF